MSMTYIGCHLKCLFFAGPMPVANMIPYVRLLFLKDRPSHKFLPRFSLEHGMDQQAQGRSKSFATTTWLMVESCQSKGTF